MYMTISPIYYTAQNAGVSVSFISASADSFCRNACSPEYNHAVYHTTNSQNKMKRAVAEICFSFHTSSRGVPTRYR